jgi:hypothetical protein
MSHEKWQRTRFENGCFIQIDGQKVLVSFSQNRLSDLSTLFTACSAAK